MSKRQEAFVIPPSRFLVVGDNFHKRFR